MRVINTYKRMITDPKMNDTWICNFLLAVSKWSRTIAKLFGFGCFTFLAALMGPQFSSKSGKRIKAEHVDEMIRFVRSTSTS